MLGFSKSYMYKLSSAGMIPCYKPTGKTLFFLRSELEAWVKRGTEPAQTPFERGRQAAAAHVSSNPI